MPVGLEPLAGTRNRNKTPPNSIFNNLRSSIKQESAPDAKFVYLTLHKSAGMVSIMFLSKWKNVDGKDYWK